MNDDHRAQLQAYMHMKQVQFLSTPRRAGKSTMASSTYGLANQGIPPTRPYPLYAIPQLIEALHVNGLRDRKSLINKSSRELDRFLTKAMKRARSNHPRDRRWKPLLDVVRVTQVAHALETS